MKIPFHNLQSQYKAYEVEINNAINEVLNSCQFIMGQEINRFETLLAQYLNRKHIITCANGTDALILALMAIGIQSNDEVITTPFSFIAAAEATSLMGAKPVFADVELETYNISVSKVEEKITPKTRAIIPVSLFGQPADMDEINKLATVYSEKYKRKIYVIEDAAQSLGATYKTRKSGNLSDLACFSFFPSKPLGCYGDGGAIALDDDLLAEKLKCLRVHGQAKRYEHKYLGFNSRLDAIQAAILQVKLKYLDNEIVQRNRIAHFYNDHLSRYSLHCPFVKPDRTSVYAQYSIRTNERSRLIELLKRNDIPTAIHYPIPLHLQTCFSHLGFAKGNFPIAERLANEILSLPMSAYVTDAQLQHIANIFSEYQGNKHQVSKKIKVTL